VLAFAVAGATLALQILIHRIVSAKLLNNYAFLVISLTMLGFAISGVLLTLFQSRVTRRLSESMMGVSCLLALSTVAATALFAGARLDAGFAMSRVSLVRSFFEWSPYALLLTIPFACSGVLLGALLADERLPTRRVYFFDLIGSAAGALIVLPLLRAISVEAAIVAVALGLVVVVGVVVPPRGPALRVVVPLTCVLLLFAFQKRGELFSIYYPKGSTLAETRNPGSHVKLEYTEWDPLARIEVSSVPGLSPGAQVLTSLIGENRAFLARYRKLITQNNYAFTFAVDYDGRPESLVGIEETIYAAAYYATPVRQPKVVAIGVGGGFDILTALRFDASRVTGVEINAATVNILKNVYKDYFRHWVSDPRVAIVNDEGRHYLSTTDERFDVIQLSGVDSYSGTPGAAHVFSENYLYTAEAFDLYLSRLSENGIINMMRLEHQPEREMLRALTTAVAALRRLGIQQPRDHIVTLTEHTGAFTALLVKRSAFSASDLGRLREWTALRPSFGISASPETSNGPQPANAYQAFLSLADEKLERTFIAQYPFAVGPVTDDRPFFFNFGFWWHLFPEDPMIWTNPPVLQMSLVLLFGAVMFAVAGAVVLPLLILLRRGVPPGPSSLRLALYFAGAALGYLAMEIALMQLFGLFLGHPNYAISVVLAALLFFSGLGARWAEPIVRRLSGIRFVSYALAVIVLLEFLLVLPRLSSGLGLPFWIRAATTALLVCPIGLCLGVFLPTAIDLMKRTSPELVPWAWGVNGVFSVLAPLLAVAAATTFGISALLLSTVPIYLLVAFSLPGPERA
jgi:spermidine synthase